MMRKDHGIIEQSKEIMRNQSTCKILDVEVDIYGIGITVVF